MAINTGPNRAFLIDANYIKTQYAGYIESNVDDYSIQSYILIAQDVNLQSLIGGYMFRYIMDGIINQQSGGGFVFSDYYQHILVNYIQPGLALWALYQMYPTLLYKGTNKALITRHSDDSSAVGIREMEYIRGQLKNNAEFYDARAIQYITNNVDQFPQYFSSKEINSIKPKSNVYQGGLYLKKNILGTPQGKNNGGCCPDYPRNLLW